MKGPWLRPHLSYITMGHLQMGKLFEGFKIVCTDFDRILEKMGETFQGGILFQVGY